MSILFGIALLTPESRTEIIRLFIDSNIGISSLVKSSGEPETKEDKLSVNLTHDENIVGCFYSLLLDKEASEENLQYIFSLVKELKVLHFGGVITSTSDCHFYAFFGNIKRETENI